MQTLSLAEFDAVAGEFDALLLTDQTIDHFCSSTKWIIPAHHALMGERTPYILASENGYIALAQANHDEVGNYLAPLEAMWGFACPCAVINRRKLARDFANFILADHSWNTAIIGGLQPNSPLFADLVGALNMNTRMGLGRSTFRHVADLSGGIDGFLSRRTAKFRSNLRRSCRQISELGITFESIDTSSKSDAAAFYSRVQQMETVSWKGILEVGINQIGMREFYRRMLARLAPGRQLIAIVARNAEADIGYIFGGALGKSYRGLQMSFDAQFSKQSLGNVLQFSMISELAERGFLRYDLGSEIAYKRRWAEGGWHSASLVISRP